jgi:lysophospholipase L1-like esterase
VVFFCGTNDLWDKKSPEQVEEDFTEFRTRLFEKLPETRLIVMAIRPSPARVSIREVEAEMNRRFRKAAEADQRITYVSGSWDRFLEDAGKPEPKLFVADGLHMSDAGYAIWKELLTPLLEQPAAAP